MKNSIIKKSLALVLTGAMAFSMPITASASPITDAYDTVDGNDKNTDTSTSTSTSTSTNTKTGTIEIPEQVEDIQLNVLGITLDKNDVAIDMSESDTDTLQARVLFDSYDAEGDAEDMQWAKVDEVTLEQKKAIEDQIHWYSYDNKIATVTAGDDKTKAVVKGVADGITTVVAYIENDGITYLDEKGKAIMRPTEGDFVAYATVTATQHADKAELTLEDVYQKHTYDLKDYTNLVFGENSKPLYECTEDVIYSGLKISNTKTTKATLKDDGTLKITKGKVGDTISFTMTTSNGAKSEATVTVQQDVPVKSLIFVDDKGAKVTKGTLDLGKEDWYKDLTVKATTEGDKKSTDKITWTISDKKGTIAVITDDGAFDDNNVAWATVNAIGAQIGNVKITAKATSGKSASFTLTISATPAKAEIYGSEIVYTGQKTQFGAVLYGENDLVIPQGKTTVKFKLDTVEGNKSNAKISSKGLLTPAALLTNGSGKSKEVMTSAVAKVSATFSNSTAKIKNKAAENTADVTIYQSDVKNVTLTAQQVGTDEKVSILGTIASDAKKADIKGLFVGTSFDVVPTGEGQEEQLDSIVWSTTGKGIIQNVNGEIPTYTLTAGGNKTVKATYYSVNWDKKKATKVVKTFNIKNLVVRAEQLTFDKSAVVVNPTTKATNVTLKIKAQAPKGAADKITWAVKAANDEAKELTVKNEKYINKTAVEDTVYYTASGKTFSTIKITLPAGLKAGSVLKVGAYAEGGAVAYSYIYVTEKTKKVIPQNVEKGNKLTVKVGETKSVPVVLNESMEAAKEKFTLGSTTAYETEPVTYSVDKKSARYVKVDQDGRITGLQKGNAKVTIKTISGKKATVKVTVNPAE